MNFEEIKTRYLAGDTDLKSETAYVYQTQGRSASLDFARSVDEQLGAEALQKVNSYLMALDAAAELQHNTEQAAALALKKAQDQAQKLSNSATTAQIADAVTRTNWTPEGQPVQQPISPLFMNPDRILPGEYVTPDTGAFKSKPASQSNKTMLFIGLALVAVVAVLYFMGSKK